MDIYKSSSPGTSTFLTPRTSPAMSQDAPPVGAGGSSSITSDPAARRRDRIAVCAYFIAEKRRFVGGDSIQDWLKAEQHIGNPAH